MNESVLFNSLSLAKEEDVLISFIVPVYNTELYVLETLDSIACTSEKIIELVVVDDGSTDFSINIIENWMADCQLPCILIKQKNGGLSSARNTGVKYARGVFLGFCDSDDRVDISSFIKMAIIAKERECDMSILRSVVFDSVLEIFQDFYDSFLWDRVLKGNSLCITNGLHEPILYRFEPNANTRLLSREFYIKANIIFPKGLHFEDFPVHVLEIAKSNKILLFDTTGYYYRVNRPGKITDQRSRKRFDILKAVAIAFDEAYAMRVDDIGLSYIISMACRMIYWCGKNTLNKDRKEFFSESCRLIQGNVSIEVYNICKMNMDEREYVVLSAYMANAVEFLVAHASKRTIMVSSILPLLINKRFGGIPRLVIKRMIKNKIQKVVSLLLPQISFIKGIK